MGFCAPQPPCGDIDSEGLAGQLRAVERDREAVDAEATRSAATKEGVAGYCIVNPAVHAHVEVGAWNSTVGLHEAIVTGQQSKRVWFACTKPLRDFGHGVGRASQFNTNQRDVKTHQHKSVRPIASQEAAHRNIRSLGVVDGPVKRDGERPDHVRASGVDTIAARLQRDDLLRPGIKASGHARNGKRCAG